MEDTKICTKCHNSLNKSFFSKDKQKRDGLACWCKKCRLAHKKEWIAKDPEYPKRYRDAHKIRKAETQREWVKKNKEKIRLYENEHKKKRRLEDSAFRIKCNLRTRIAKKVSRIAKGSVKVGSAIRDCGCSIDFLMAYIESLWKPGMGWGNYGGRTGWQIDHIIPLAAFDLSDRTAFLCACHYTNLQPLWPKENLDKRNEDGSLVIRSELSHQGY